MIPLTQSQITIAAREAWIDSNIDLSFAEWLEKQKLAGLYWGG